MSAPLSKAELRAEAKILRAANQHRRAEMDRLLCKGLRAWLLEGEEAPRGAVVTYRSLPGEPDPEALQHDLELRDAGIRFAVTRTPDDCHALTVHPADSPMEQHRFGYAQPVADAPVISDADIVAVLVPGLGFDRFGNRLGFGAGYYDRFLARVACPIMVGVTDDVMATRLPTDPHDIAMTHIASAAGVSFAQVDRRIVR